MVLSHINNDFFPAPEKPRAYVHTICLAIPVRIGGGWGQAGAQVTFRLPKVVAENALRVHVGGDISVPWGGGYTVRINGHDVRLCEPTRVPLFEENIIDVQIVHPLPICWIGEQLVVLTIEIDYIATEEEHEQAVEETRKLNEVTGGDGVVFPLPEEGDGAPSPFPLPLPQPLASVVGVIIFILFLVLLLKLLRIARG